jgi:hypothetical protein
MDGSHAPTHPASLAKLDHLSASHASTSTPTHDVTESLMMVEGRGCRQTEWVTTSYWAQMAALLPSFCGSR